MSSAEVEVQGRLLAEYVDQGRQPEIPPLARARSCYPAPSITTSITAALRLRAFTVLLQNRGTVTVLGRSVVEKGSSAAVLSHDAAAEVTAALVEGIPA
ncbi:MAG: hypothetical protein ACRC33_19105 [Gemmataceae bacterium]